MYNYVHRGWFFTSRLWRHNCIILRIRLISLLLSNHYMRLRCNPAKGRLTDNMFSFRKKVFCFMTNGIHFRMVVTCTCYLNNMYDYRYQERTPNNSEHTWRRSGKHTRRKASEQLEMISAPSTGRMTSVPTSAPTWRMISATARAPERWWPDQASSIYDEWVQL